tara:strand:- start:1596 stop:3209 length:1614 start_codon:yes stop_codon:yes gene_type:complete
VARVKFNKLTLGHALTREDVWDNLDQCATALSGNISADQRRENRSYFTVTLQKVRVGPNADPNTGDTEDKILRFFLPPLQEYFSESFVGDLNTPEIILESISLSFDGANQQYPIHLGTGLPDATKTFERDFVAEIKAGSFVGKVTIPQTSLNISNSDIVNRPNPTLSSAIGANLDPYSELQLVLKSPLITQYSMNAGGAEGLTMGIDNVVVSARFSAPIVQRDTFAYCGTIPQNIPTAVGTGRSVRNCNLLTPGAGSLIKAGDRSLAATDGIQDAFTQLDRLVSDKLRGGLTRWSEQRLFTESLVEDQGYFCITVPLFNIPEVNMGFGNFTHRRTLDGYIRPSSLRSVDALMDRAVIPIVAPGTLHHVGIFWDKFRTSNAQDQFHMDFGLALGSAPNSIVDSYTQVCQLTAQNITFASSTDYTRHVWAPLPYSTAAGAPAKGSGYVTQGRPYFFGRQVDTTGGTLRQPVADPANPAASEVAPATNGREQFFEIRCNLYRYDTSTPQYVDIDHTKVAFETGGWSGVVVCLYGKMALVE